MIAPVASSFTIASTIEVTEFFSQYPDNKCGIWKTCQAMGSIFSESILTP